MLDKRGSVINNRAEFFIFCVILLFLYYVDIIPFNEYLDDLSAALLAIPILNGLLQKRYTRTEMQIMYAVLSMCILGLLSNCFSGIITNFGFILNDGFSFVRIFLVYFGTIALLRGKTKALQCTLNRLGNYSKIFICIAFVFGVLNIFGIVNMYSYVRFGLPLYFFFFGNASQFGIFMGCVLALLIFSGKNELIYEIMALACLILTFKGMGLIIATVYLVLTVVVRKRLKMWHCFCVLFFLTYILQYQITNYIVDKSAPRAMLIKYGLITAIRFFPFGAGFASFGSNMAAVHYSPLYYKYGFHLIPSLTVLDDGTTYLNDAYLGMIAGQFGIIGLFLMVFILYKLGISILKNNKVQDKSKYITLACFGCFSGMAVMAGSIKTAGGEMLMIIFAIFQLLDSVRKKTNRQGISDLQRENKC